MVPVQLEDAMAASAAGPQSLFDKLDTNHDGILTRQEFDAAQQTGMLSEVSPDQAQVGGSTPFDIGLQKWSSGYSIEVQQAEQQSVSGRTHSDQGSAVRG